MTIQEAIKELKSGAFWKYTDNMPDFVRERLCDAIETALEPIEMMKNLVEHEEAERARNGTASAAADDDHMLICSIRSRFQDNNSARDVIAAVDAIEAAKQRANSLSDINPAYAKVLELVYDEFLKVESGRQWYELADATHNLPFFLISNDRDMCGEQGRFIEASLRCYANTCHRDVFATKVLAILYKYNPDYT